MDVRIVVGLGFESGNGSLKLLDLILEGRNLPRGQIVNFLVYLLDVDFVVGTSGRKQGGSRKEQRCKFGEFDFHKVGYGFKD